MTIDTERFRTIENVRDFLYSLMDRKQPVPKTTELRKRAYRLLKHYPEEYFIEKLKEAYYGGKDEKTKNTEHMLYLQRIPQ